MFLIPGEFNEHIIEMELLINISVISLVNFHKIEEQTLLSVKT